GRERPSERELAVPMIVRATAAAGTDGESVATVIHDRGRRAPPGKGARAGAEHAAVAAARTWSGASPAKPQRPLFLTACEIAQQQLPAAERDLAVEHHRVSRREMSGLPAAGRRAEVRESAPPRPHPCRGGIVIDHPPRQTGGDRAGGDQGGGGSVQRRAVVAALLIAVLQQPLSKQAQVELGVEGDHECSACQNCGTLNAMDSQAVVGEALGVAVAAGVPVLLWGAPGTGKTSVVRALAEGAGLPCETVIASIR